MEGFSGAFLLDNRLDEMTLIGNEDALCGALLNLINNAVEAGAELISVKVESSAQGIEIRIQDNGPGIAQVVQKQLFEPFYTTKIHGTGLGLAVVDSVVKAHAGSVTCQSELGQGSVFILTLPICEAELGLSLAGVVPVMQEKHYETV